MPIVKTSYFSIKFITYKNICQEKSCFSLNKPSSEIPPDDIIAPFKVYIAFMRTVYLSPCPPAREAGAERTSTTRSILYSVPSSHIIITGTIFPSVLNFARTSTKTLTSFYHFQIQRSLLVKRVISDDIMCAVRCVERKKFYE